MAIKGIFQKDKERKREGKEKKEKADLKRESIAWRVIESPYISEKATGLEKENKYVFKILDKATKPQVKGAVKEIYGVNVLDVKIVKIPRKRKRLGRHRGWKKGFKKAIIEIEKGQKLDIHPK